MKKSRSELLDLYAKKKRDIDYCKKIGYEYEKYLSLKRLEKLKQKPINIC